MGMLAAILIFLALPSAQAQWTSELFMQTVHLHKFHDTIAQGFVHTGKDVGQLRVYGGVWFDQDTKTGRKEAFTDAQISPLAGVRSQLFFEKWLPSRAFGEFRFVQRTVNFPDKRTHQDWEARAGFLGYDFVSFNSPFFLEHYYALFYTRIYGGRILLQGWQRQGLRFWEHFDVFNDVMVDTFDQTRGRDGTLDLRPGVRLFWRGQVTSVQLLHQYVHHFANIAFAGRNEHRTTLVLGHAF